MSEGTLKLLLICGTQDFSKSNMFKLLFFIPKLMLYSLEYFLSLPSLIIVFVFTRSSKC